MGLVLFGLFALQFVCFLCLMLAYCWCLVLMCFVVGFECNSWLLFFAFY